MVEDSSLENSGVEVLEEVVNQIHLYYNRAIITTTVWAVGIL